MPIYDRVCEDGHQTLDLYEQIKADDPLCKECGKVAKRTLLPGRTGGVVQDSIEGGVWIRHGLCNEDGSPRKYYSHTEINAEARRRGLRNLVEHVPERGSDKSKHTTKWQ